LEERPKKKKEKPKEALPKKEVMEEQEPQTLIAEKKAQLNLKKIEEQPKAAEEKRLAAKEKEQQLRKQKKVKQKQEKELKEALHEEEKAFTKKKSKLVKESEISQELLAEEKAFNENHAQYLDNRVDKYKTMILNAIAKQWLVPDNTDRTLSCKLQIQLTAEGKVLGVTLVKSSGDVALDRSAIAAVYKASPLPVPQETDLLQQFRMFNLTVRPETIVGSVP
jgi:colicin import membrane protein